MIAVGTDGAVVSCTDNATGSLAGGHPCAMWPVTAHIVITSDIVTVLDP